ncbi:CRAL/TRIO domain-containing protein [Saccharata proteae CBS 121410]|uniref:Phosphatidylinositol transfer protein SFH5 n=1 Tax=Saccharata proteae CBS 121410 TaxID=1314787 RepID=A0A9P4HVF0_9PEZI|nr:CRAL/TRIO domain-containing protein [Saccharata proteae CBS 121410]
MSTSSSTRRSIADLQTGTPAAGETDGPVWPDLNEEHPLTELLNKLPDAVKEADGYNEVYGIILNPENPDFHTKLICQKFLRANHNFADKAREQLVDTLKWRKEFQPLKVKDEVFSREKFEGLGFVVELEGVGWTANKKDVVTFNVYGAVKDNKMTFGDGDAFIRWRVALMELSIAALNLSAASQPIPDWGAGPDPYQAIQVHDYLSVSFFRQDPHVKAASKKTIDLFQKVYPETLSRKYFVNVPTIMGWMFSAMKLFLSKDTVQKFTVLSSGDNLVEDLGEGVPVVYGGKARSLEEIGTETKLE